MMEAKGTKQLQWLTTSACVYCFARAFHFYTYTLPGQVMRPGEIVAELIHDNCMYVTACMRVM